MQVFTTVNELRKYRSSLSSGTTTGFVPTMGALHEGHLSLIRQSVAGNQITLSSIFVNPIQFNNAEDLKKYPRMPEADLAMLEGAGCDVVFMPDVQEMYPEPDTRHFDFGPLEQVMEGAFRPGHFNGVAIVVDKLFSMVQPHRAYFGMKDYQQLCIIRAMAALQKHTVEIIGCPIIREPDGLAMSSRNLRLTHENRSRAPEIYRTLLRMKERSADTPLRELISEAKQHLDAIPGFRTEYIEIADSVTLQPLESLTSEQQGIICAAVYAGEIRLIDNLML